MKAYVFPGQGAQFPGMAKDLYDTSSKAKNLLETANDILGFRITDIMFDGTADELKQTKVTQPAIFLHSVVLAKITDSFLTRYGSRSLFRRIFSIGSQWCSLFEDGLALVSKRAMAMQKACEINPSTMAAILGLEDQVVENLCSAIDEIVIAANYNCPGQLVISGSHKGIELACEAAKEAGARRVLPLPVGGAFHSPLMEPARASLNKLLTQPISMRAFALFIKT